VRAASTRDGTDGRAPSLFIIRGNSGSGKSTIARRLRDEIRSRGDAPGVALVEQDYFRRFILKEKESEGSDAVDLIHQIVSFALERGCDVILEGILNTRSYGVTLRNLTSRWPQHHVFYLDVSFEETLKRHATKPNASEFGEKEMREWWRDRDLTNLRGEVVLPETLSLDDLVQVILEEVRL
jgi:adenylate kinase family enzyme